MKIIIKKKTNCRILSFFFIHLLHTFPFSFSSSISNGIKQEKLHTTQSNVRFNNFPNFIIIFLLCLCLFICRNFFVPFQRRDKVAKFCSNVERKDEVILTGTSFIHFYVNSLYFFFFTLNVYFSYPLDTSKATNEEKVLSRFELFRKKKKRNKQMIKNYLLRHDLDSDLK